MSNSVFVSAYEFKSGSDFDASFSKVSIESILFYIFAAAAHVLEVLFDTHKSEVEELLDNMTAHTTKWYRDKALNFMKGMPLITDSDEYDTTGMSDSAISAAKVVTYAAAVEESGSSVLIIKIATGEVGSLKPIDDKEIDSELTQFTAYIQQIKDAGVRFNVVNQTGDDFKCELTVYYNPTLLASDVRKTVLAAISSYLNGLPFNGEYSNMALIDAVQAVEGVKIADFKWASSGTPLVSIGEKTTPAAGYFTYDESNITLNLNPYAG